MGLLTNGGHGVCGAVKQPDEGRYAVQFAHRVLVGRAARCQLSNCPGCPLRKWRQHSGLGQRACLGHRNFQQPADTLSYSQKTLFIPSAKSVLHAEGAHKGTSAQRLRSLITLNLKAYTEHGQVLGASILGIKGSTCYLHLISFGRAPALWAASCAWAFPPTRAVSAAAAAADTELLTPARKLIAQLHGHFSLDLTSSNNKSRGHENQKNIEQRKEGGGVHRCQADEQGLAEQRGPTSERCCWAGQFCNTTKGQPLSHPDLSLQKCHNMKYSLGTCNVPETYTIQCPSARLGKEMMKRNVQHHKKRLPGFRHFVIVLSNSLFRSSVSCEQPWPATLVRACRAATASTGSASTLVAAISASTPPGIYNWRVSVLMSGSKKHLIQVCHSDKAKECSGNGSTSDTG